MPTSSATPPKPGSAGLDRLRALLDEVADAAPSERAALVVEASQDAWLLSELIAAGKAEWWPLLARLEALCAYRPRAVRDWRSALLEAGREQRSQRSSAVSDWPEIEVPTGYVVDGSGVWEVDDDGEHLVCPVPLMLVARVQDVEGGAEAVVVSWRRDGRLHDVTVERVDVSDARRIVATLAPHGCPVTSVTAAGVVGYLAAVERANLGTLPMRRSTSRMGWVVDGDPSAGFVLGLQHIAPPEAPEVLCRLDPGVAEAQGRHMAPGPFSSLEGWLEVGRLAARHPRVMVGLYASLAAPLVALVGSPNVLVDVWGLSSRGKTTTIRVAVSVWGNPGDDALVGSWRGTDVGLERWVAAMRDLPVALDDTQHARDPKVITSMAYQYASGRGKARGRPDGLRATPAIRGALLSTGERSMTSRSEDIGTRGRVLEITGDPWTGDDPAGDVAAALALTADHHGVAGVAFLRWLIEHAPAEQGAWRDRHRHLTAAYQKRAGELAAEARPLAGRLGQSVALLQVAAELAERALGLELCPEALQAAWEAACAGAVEGDRAAAALRSVYRWAASRPTAFYGRHERDRDGSNRVPHTGWLGAWNGSETWSEIAYQRDPLTARLQELGHDPEATLAQWVARGWLRVEQRGDRASDVPPKVTIDNARVRCVVVLRAAFEQVGEA